MLLWQGYPDFAPFESHRAKLAARARKIEPMIRFLLQDLQVLAYEPEDATATAAIRAALAKRGTRIGPYDVMIAGTALRSGLVDFLPAYPATCEP